MATAKKTTTKSPSAVSKKTATSKKVEQKISAPKKTTRKKVNSEMTASDVEMDSAPKTKVITKKYLYAVVGVIAVVAVLFIASRFWVVAWVDNKPITKFELYSLMEKRDEGKTAEELIVQRLLKSEGQKQKQNISDAEIEAEIKKIEEAQGGAAQLDQVLAINKTSREDFRKLVELQLIKQKLFGGGINITDEDVAKYIEENKASLPPTMLENPDSSEAAKLRESVKEQLKQTKVNENFNKWLEEALQSSRVMRMVAAPTPPPAIPQQMAPQ